MTKKVSEIFGCMVFNDDVMRERLPKEVYKSLTKTIATGKTIDASVADVVANAMKDWAIEKGATHYTHWFQPLTGVTAEKHDSFISPVGPCKVVMEFSGKELIKGESDASSFPSGGLRATFEARGYTAWDPASYAFVKDGSLYIPTAFCSYTGDALDAKTPLLRSMDAISTQGIRLLRLFGDTKTKRLTTTVGAEQEYFIVDKKMYDLREDLQFTGRTLFGAPAPKGQELEDHYFGPLKSRISAFMTDLDEALWTLGINSKTKHNEAAPAQHELAPIYATTNMAVDQNLLIMEYMKKIAEKHDLVCLLHEKPYAGVNGSGKHNNWSISTDGGKNLLDAGKTPAENAKFLLILAAIIKAVDDYQDLMRISVAYPGNDHRLGANEAPPAIVSIFLGEELDQIIKSIIDEKTYEGVRAGIMDLGIPTIPTFRKDTTDRNRTSPFAFTGNKFEFRMVGSSQNIAMPNTVLNTTVAESFRQFADILENADDFDVAVGKLLRDTFAAHSRIIFDGNGYSEEWQKEAERRGLLNLRTSVDAYKCFNDDKNVKLFTTHGVMSRVELESRQEIYFENYSKIINIEALTMIDMASRDIIPAVNSYLGEVANTAAAKMSVLPTVNCSVERDILTRLSELNAKAYRCIDELKAADKAATSISDVKARAEACCNSVIPAMNALREAVDEMETITSSEYWPMPTYSDLMFKI
ncbi:MAG: glutamine synthetase III [Clostridia bacterium]|nr:glutamine synthetase III [Clostridia bacterium]MBQ8850814.1 glutamine synthetase III [Clostridia bacterium]